MHFKIELIDGRKYLYLAENAMVDGKHKRVMHKYVGSPEQVHKMLEGIRNIKLRSYSFGRPAALLHAAERLDLVEIIDRNVEKRDVRGLTVGQYAMLLITARTEGTLSRNQVERWFKNSVLQFVLLLLSAASLRPQRVVISPPAGSPDVWRGYLPATA